jgi:hypothetical protein
MKVVVFIVSAFWIVMPLWALQQVVADPPEVRGPFTLLATYDSATGHNAFSGRECFIRGSFSDVEPLDQVFSPR